MKTTERGWPGYFIGAARCIFRRNTLIEHENTSIVVSTIGFMLKLNGSEYGQIGSCRYYETMALYSNKTDWCINKIDTEVGEGIHHMDEANSMHDTVVKEISESLLRGEVNLNETKEHI